MEVEERPGEDLGDLLSQARRDAAAETDAVGGETVA